MAQGSVDGRIGGILLLTAAHAFTAPVIVQQGIPIDLGAGWIPEAVNSSDEVAMKQLGVGATSARWNGGTITDLQAPSLLQVANGGYIETLTGISDSGSVVGDGVADTGTDPHLSSTDAGGQTIDENGTVGLIWSADSVLPIELDPHTTLPGSIPA